MGCLESVEGMVEWTTGMEYWNRTLEWNTGIEHWNELGHDVCAYMYRIASSIKFSRIIH